jgi:hypothetical protein
LDSTRKVESDAPHHIAAAFVDDDDEVRFSGTDQDVVGIKALVACAEQVLGTERHQ